MEQAQVGVVIPTYNRAHLLPRAIESARAAGAKIDIIVVDNRSTDGTAELCRSLQGINYVRLETNLGPARARNVGVASSSAPYFVFLDDDDVLLPGSLDTLRQRLDKSPDAALCYGRVFIGDQNCVSTGELFPAETPEGDVFWKLLERNFIVIHSALVRRTCLESAGLFDPALVLNEDWDLWVRLAEKWPVAAVDQPVGIVRTGLLQHDRLSFNRQKMARQGMRVFQRWMQLPRAQNATDQERKRAHKQSRRWHAWTLGSEVIDAVKTKRFSKIASPLVAAIRLSPYFAIKRLCYGMKNFFSKPNKRPSPISS
jgi:glycosyltransferase involved in cell wall biosynthesis